jgi:hypothetical protein
MLEVNTFLYITALHISKKLKTVIKYVNTGQCREY